MRYQFLIQYLALLLAGPSLFGCGSATTKTAAAASKDSGQVAGHRVVKILPRREFKSLGGSNSLLLPQVVFESDNEVFWIGSLTALYTYDESKEAWNVLSGRGSDVPLGVDTICQSADHKVWLRSVLYTSLRTYDGHMWRTTEQLGPDLIDRLPQVMFQGWAGRVWVVLKEGLSSYDGRGWSNWLRPSREAEEVYARLPKTTKLASRLEEMRQRWRKSTPAIGEKDQAFGEKREGLITDVRVALEARSGYVWLSSRFALVAFHPASGDWKVHELPMNAGNPRHVFEDKDGGLWLVDDKGQVLSFDPDHVRWAVYDLNSLVTIDSAKVSSAVFVNGICQDRQGRIILASNNGIIIFDQAKKTWELFTVHNLTMSDSNITSTMQDKRGRIWLGTNERILILEE